VRDVESKAQCSEENISTSDWHASRAADGLVRDRPYRKSLFLGSIQSTSGQLHRPMAHVISLQQKDFRNYSGESGTDSAKSFWVSFFRASGDSNQGF
jgi:hypothetical protein